MGIMAWRVEPMAAKTRISYETAIEGRRYIFIVNQNIFEV
jgi:hypothetical protein